MARPISESIDYFSLDVDMDQDDKVAYLESKHGFVAFGIIVRLLMRIYKNGYYTTWTEREQYLFARNINVDIALTQTIVNDCINEGIFNKNLYERYNILTSHGIQVRYLKAVERRKKVTMTQEYFLVNPAVDDVKINNVTLTSINADINPDSVDTMLAETTQSKVKESKVINNINAHAREGQPVDSVDNVDNFSGEPDVVTGEPVHTDDSSPEFLEFWASYPKHADQGKTSIAWQALMLRGIPPSLLIRAAQRYALKQATKEEKFIKKAANWLNEGGYYECLPRNLPECPRCAGAGYYERTEDDGVRTAICDCRKEIFGNLVSIDNISA